MTEPLIPSNENQTRHSAGGSISHQSAALQSALDVIAKRFPGFKVVGEPAQLTGGYINYVWRIIGSDPKYPKSIIAKWFPSFVASSPDIPLDSARIKIEANAMALFAPGARFSKLSPMQVRPPLLYKLDEPASVILMDDIGDYPSLRDWLTHPHTTDEAAQTGDLLGRFIGMLHKQSALDKSLAADFDNRIIQQTRAKHLYGQIESFAALAGLSDSAALGKAAVQTGEWFTQPGVCLVMGDLWPRSIVVTNKGLCIFDWELAHFGRPSQDVGHLIAHLWMHKQLAADSPTADALDALMQQFLKSYRETIAPVLNEIWSIRDIADCAVHFGCELFTRTVGTFAQGSLYSGLPPSHPTVIEATQAAAQHIREPLKVDTFDSFISLQEREALASAESKSP